MAMNTVYRVQPFFVYETFMLSKGYAIANRVCTYYKMNSDVGGAAINKYNLITISSGKDI